MIENPKSLTEQLLNLVERVATEMKALFATVQTKQDKGDYATNASLTSGLAGKANTAHGHAIADVTGLQSALDAKAPTGDYLTPTTADARYLSKTGKAVSAGTADSAGTATKATQDAQGNVINTTYATKTELSGKANTSHTHEQAQVTGLTEALAGKAAATHIHTTAQVTGLDTALAGKAAASHTHEIASVNGLQTVLDAKQPAGNYSAVGHTHTKANITDFAHNHATSEITGLDAVLAGKAASTHTHTTAQVTGLDTALAGKAETSAVIPKANSRGTLAGYETPLVQATALSVTNATNDSSCVTGAVAITVNDGAANESWTKTVALTNASATVTLGTNWKWVGGSAPTISANCVLVLHWCNSFGIANLVASS